MKKLYAYNKFKRRISLSLALILAGVGPCALSGVNNVPSYFGGEYIKQLSHIAYAQTTTEITLKAEHFDGTSEIAGFSPLGEQEFKKAVDSDASEIKIIMDTDATSIAKDAFKEKFTNEVTNGKPISIKFPSSLESIGEHAFSNNKSLVEILDLKDMTNLKTIYDEAFYDSGLRGELILPENIVSIWFSAFRKNNLTYVSLPDNIVELFAGVFADNQISDIHLGKLTNIRGLLWGKYGKGGEHLHPEAGVLSYDLFRNNNLTELRIEGTGIKRTGSYTFRNNNLNKVVLQDDITMLNYGVFQDNPNLTTIRIAGKEDATHNQIAANHINGYAFKGTKLTGKLEFTSANIEVNSSRAFEDNPITEIIFPNGWVTTGPYSFRKVPLENVNLPTPNIVENGVYADTDTLKNVNFDKYTKDIIPAQMFRGGKLRSLEIPSSINKFDTKNHYVLNPNHSLSSFADNIGWIDGDNRVALYRKNNGFDNTLKSGDYVIDNSLSDGADYVFNPILVKFKLIDQNGNNVAESSLPNSIKMSRTRTTNGTPDTQELSDIKLVDYTSFKLGDTITFEMPDSLEGYKLVEDANLSNSQLTKISDKKYSFTLDPTNENITQEERYIDENGNDLGYNIGYKKSNINLKYEALPVTLNFVFEKELSDGSKQNLQLSDIPQVRYTSKNKAATTNLTSSSINDLLYGDTVDIELSNNGALTPLIDTHKINLSGTDVEKIDGEDRYQATVTLRYKDTPNNSSGNDNNNNQNENTPQPQPQPNPQPNPNTDNSNNNTNTNQQSGGGSTDDDVNSNTIPPVNPPTNVPYTPNNIINADIIPNVTNPVFNIISPEDTPLGNAIIDADKGTYTFIDEDTTPLGSAKINPDNSLEIVEVYEDNTPLSLPKTGQENNLFMQFFGAFLTILGLGFLFNKKKINSY